MSSTNARKVLNKLPSLAAMWEGLQGPGKNPVESFEQRIVRKWLQGQGS